VLDVDHGYRRGPGPLDESGNAHYRFVERLGDFFLAGGMGSFQDGVLNIDDKKRCLGGMHISI
jgi:hypothetical protein